MGRHSKRLIALMLTLMTAVVFIPSMSFAEETDGGSVTGEHHFADEYTVDKKAGVGVEGSKSRHCLDEGCDARTDIYTIEAIDEIVPTHLPDLVEYTGEAIELGLLGIVDISSRPVPTLVIENVRGEVIPRPNWTEGPDGDYEIIFSNNINVGGSANFTIYLHNSEYEATLNGQFSIYKAYQTVTVSPDPLTIEAGDSQQLTVSGVGDMSYSVKEEDSSGTVFVDEEGKVYGLKKGNATVEVKAEGDSNHHSATAQVPVSVFYGVKNIKSVNAPQTPDTLDKYYATGDQVIADLPKTTKATIYDDSEADLSVSWTGPSQYDPACGANNTFTWTADKGSYRVPEGTQMTGQITIRNKAHSYADKYTVDQKAGVGSEGSKSRYCTNSACSANTDVTVIPAMTDVAEVTDPDSIIYTGEAIVPAVKVSDSNGQNIIGESWEQGADKDYEILCTDNTDAGHASMTVKIHSQEYEGEAQGGFSIYTAVQNIQVDPDPIRVKLGKKLKVKVQAYGKVTYKSSNKKIATVSKSGVVKGIRRGSATIKIHAAGDANHMGGNYDIKIIVPKNIKGATLNKKTYTYNGELQQPYVKTVNKSRKLKYGVDYESEIPESVEPGTYYVRVIGLGKYIGTYKAKYVIKKAPQKISLEVPTVYVKGTAQLQPTAIGSGAYTYKIADKKSRAYASVNADGVITGKKAGSAKIRISKAGDRHYLAASKTITVKIIKPEVSLP